MKEYYMKKSLPGEILNIISLETVIQDKHSLDIIHRDWRPKKIGTTYGYNKFGKKEEI